MTSSEAGHDPNYGPYVWLAIDGMGSVHDHAGEFAVIRELLLHGALPDTPRQRIGSLIKQLID